MNTGNKAVHEAVALVRREASIAATRSHQEAYNRAMGGLAALEQMTNPENSEPPVHPYSPCPGPLLRNWAGGPL